MTIIYSENAGLCVTNRMLMMMTTNFQCITTTKCRYRNFKPLWISHNYIFISPCRSINVIWYSLEIIWIHILNLFQFQFSHSLTTFLIISRITLFASRDFTCSYWYLNCTCYSIIHYTSLCLYIFDMSHSDLNIREHLCLCAYRIPVRWDRAEQASKARHSLSATQNQPSSMNR